MPFAARFIGLGKFKGIPRQFPPAGGPALVFPRQETAHELQGQGVAAAELEEFGKLGAVGAFACLDARVLEYPPGLVAVQGVVLFQRQGEALRPARGIGKGVAGGEDHHPLGSPSPGSALHPLAEYPRFMGIQELLQEGGEQMVGAFVRAPGLDHLQAIQDQEIRPSPDGLRQCLHAPGVVLERVFGGGGEMTKEGRDETILALAFLEGVPKEDAGGVFAISGRWFPASLPG